jgi:hypothetical protein
MPRGDPRQRGESHYCAKLTDAAVLFIRRSNLHTLGEEHLNAKLTDARVLGAWQMPVTRC